MQKSNILIVTLVAVAVYWLFGMFSPEPYVSSFASFALLVFGGVALARYAPAAWDVAANGRRLSDDGKDGSHLAVYGIAMLAAGSVYLGLFGLVWVLNGQPEAWTGTAMSGFGRALMAGGFWLMYISPDVVQRDMRVPSLAWIAVVVVASVLTGIYLGTKLGD
jgi:hypothetical protein